MTAVPMMAVPMTAVPMMAVPMTAVPMMAAPMVAAPMVAPGPALGCDERGDRADADAENGQAPAYPFSQAPRAASRGSS